jgi:ketosteroid isomerase-like protein
MWADVMTRLTSAMNAHDLDAFVDCFDPEYDSEQPAHPDRHFTGRDQVRRNWSAMFAGLPDFHAEVLRSSGDDNTFWVEWHWTGTRADNTSLNARGASIFGIRDDRIVWGRLYMEDVEVGYGINAAVARLASRKDS